MNYQQPWQLESYYERCLRDRRDRDYAQLLHLFALAFAKIPTAEEKTEVILHWDDEQ